MKCKTKTKVANPVFTIWIGNHNSQKLNIFISDLRTKINKWLFSKERTWIECTPNDMIVAMFLADKEGANCTYEKKDFPELSRLLSLDIKNHMNRIEVKK